MRIYLNVFLAICLLGVLSCKDHDDVPVVKRAVAELEAKNKSTLIGIVVFTEISGLVTMEAFIAGVSPGEHAIHIHAEGDCSAPDGTSAGGHWNPTSEDHGIWGEDPFHRGDIGNILVEDNGTGSISRSTDLWCVGCDDESKNVVGKAIIVHAGPDDFSSQPSGAAGPRIGCGEILLEN